MNVCQDLNLHIQAIFTALPNSNLSLMQTASLTFLRTKDVHSTSMVHSLEAGHREKTQTGKPEAGK